ncbi:MAG: hypothetical protein ACRCR9_02030 [Chitinophagaceae bacterium]
MHIHIENADGIAKFEIASGMQHLENQGVKNKNIKFAQF